MFEDVTFEAIVHGEEQLRGFANAAFTAIPDIAFALKGYIAAEPGAAIEWVMSGTHKGDFPGLPATGKRVRSGAPPSRAASAKASAPRFLRSDMPMPRSRPCPRAA